MNSNICFVHTTSSCLVPSICGIADIHALRSQEVLLEATTLSGQPTNYHGGSCYLFAYVNAWYYDSYSIRSVATICRTLTTISSSSCWVRKSQEATDEKLSEPRSLPCNLSVSLTRPARGSRISLSHTSKIFCEPHLGPQSRNGGTVEWSDASTNDMSRNTPNFELCQHLSQLQH